MKLHIDPPNDFNSLYIKRVQEIFYFMTNYSQSANPNATNSELDAKRIITYKELTSLQRDELIQSFVELVVDGMDTKTLVQIVSDNMTDYYDKCSDLELKEEVDNYDEDLYSELVDNVTNETVLDINNNGGQF